MYTQYNKVLFVVSYAQCKLASYNHSDYFMTYFCLLSLNTVTGVS